MEPPPPSFLRHGSAEPLPERHHLRAGPLTLVLEAGDVRCVELGGREVIRRIYGAVRDRDWGTVRGEITDLRLAVSGTESRITYTSTHRRGDVHFVWQAEILLRADGTIRFSFDGEARSAFLRNRIGLCVLHPLRECAGARVRTLHHGGARARRRFPEHVAIEQPIAGFTDLAGLAHEVGTGCWAELRFEGEAFETEDQRNWIDASFKTYGTPLRLPRPVKVAAGTRVRQAVTLYLRTPSGVFSAGNAAACPAPAARVGNCARLPAAERPASTVRFGGAVRGCLPRLGLGVASHGRPLSAREVERLTRLGPAHLRVDLRLATPPWRDSLRLAAREALQLGAALELVLHLPADQPGDLAAVAAELARLGADPLRALILREGRKTTPAADLAAARAALGGGGLAIGAGTDADLYQLQLHPPPPDADFLAWSMNPQVHADDLTSIAETPEAAAAQVLSMRARFGAVPLVVSPITLKPRFNAVAAGPEPPPPPDVLPPQVDPRQMSLFGAAWTLAMLAALAPAGVESLTFFETTGWRGVMETAAGSPLPAEFSSIPGGVFPLYHVLAGVAEWAGGEVLDVAVEPASGLAALALRRGGHTALWLANLTPETRRVRLPKLPGPAHLRRLEEANVLAAMTDPEAFQHTAEELLPVDPGPLALAAFAVVRLQFPAD